MTSQRAIDNFDPWQRRLAECAGLIMPDGSIRPIPPWYGKPQGQLTEQEIKEAVALQEEHLTMQRARNLNGEDHDA
jgi:hypothetical protein